MKSDFEKLKTYWPILAETAVTAENLLHYDNNSCVVKLGIFCEILVKEILTSERLYQYIDLSHYERIEVLQRLNLLPHNIINILHKIRMTRNAILHENEIISDYEAVNLVNNCHELADWFVKTYGCSHPIRETHSTVYKNNSIITNQNNNSYSFDNRNYQKKKKDYVIIVSLVAVIVILIMILCGLYAFYY